MGGVWCDERVLLCIVTDREVHQEAYQKRRGTCGMLVVSSSSAI